MEITYDLIKPLIVSAESEKRTMLCEFSLPDSEEVYASSARIPKKAGTASAVKRALTSSIASQFRRSTSRLLMSSLGSGFLGRTARRTVSAATRGSTRNIDLGPSNAEKEIAVVEAFENVSQHFEYSNGSWGKPTAPVKPKELSPFEKQLQANPVTSTLERNVFARLLAHLAYADGSLADEEKSFFDDSIPDELGSIDELAQTDPVSAIEAEGLNSGVKDTIYTFAWVISLIDMDIDEKEKVMLMEYGQKFGYSESKIEELSKLAKFHVLDGNLSMDISRDDLFALGTKLGLSNDDAERAKVAWMKRQ